MTIPDNQTVMLPLLRFAADKREHSTREGIEKLANHFNLSEDERKELLPSGGQATFDNRVGWGAYIHEEGRAARSSPSRLLQDYRQRIGQTRESVHISFGPVAYRHIRQRLWGERAAVMAGAVHLVLARALLRSLFVACRPRRSPYQVTGEDRYGRG